MDTDVIDIIKQDVKEAREICKEMLQALAEIKIDLNDAISELDTTIDDIPNNGTTYKQIAILKSISKDLKAINKKLYG